MVDGSGHRKHFVMIALPLVELQLHFIELESHFVELEVDEASFLGH